MNLEGRYRAARAAKTVEVEAKHVLLEKKIGFFYFWRRKFWIFGKHLGLLEKFLNLEKFLIFHQLSLHIYIFKY